MSTLPRSLFFFLKFGAKLPIYIYLWKGYKVQGSRLNLTKRTRFLRMAFLEFKIMVLQDVPEEHSLVILSHVILKMSLVVTFMDAKFWVPMAVVLLLLLNGHSEWLLSV